MGLTAEEGRRRFEVDGLNAIPERQSIDCRLPRQALGPVSWLLEPDIVLELALDNDVHAVLIVVLVALDAVLAFGEEGRCRGARPLAPASLGDRARGADRCLAGGSRSTAHLGDLPHVRRGDLEPADLTRSAPRPPSNGLCSPASRLAFRDETALYATRALSSCEARLLVRPQRRASGPTLAIPWSYGDLARSGAPRAAHRGRCPCASRPRCLLARRALGDRLIRYRRPDRAFDHFHLLSALGARKLARRGVVVTRLEAIEEAGRMEVLCIDKTGTITENRFKVGDPILEPPAMVDELLRVAASASDAATEDPLDLVILRAAAARGGCRCGPQSWSPRRSPRYQSLRGAHRVVYRPAEGGKGAPEVIAGLYDAGRATSKRPCDRSPRPVLRSSAWRPG